MQRVRRVNQDADNGDERGNKWNTGDEHEPARPILANENSGGTMLKAGMAMAAITLLGAALPAISKYPQGTEAPRSLNLVGEIMDSRCALEGSHDKMMRQNGTKEARECTLQCAKSGGS